MFRKKKKTEYEVFFLATTEFLLNQWHRQVGDRDCDDLVRHHFGSEILDWENGDTGKREVTDKEKFLVADALNLHFSEVKPYGNSEVTIHADGEMSFGWDVIYAIYSGWVNGKRSTEVVYQFEFLTIFTYEKVEITSYRGHLPTVIRAEYSDYEGNEELICSDFISIDPPIKFGPDELTKRLYLRQEKVREMIQRRFEYPGLSY